MTKQLDNTAITKHLKASLKIALETLFPGKFVVTIPDAQLGQEALLDGSYELTFRVTLKMLPRLPAPQTPVEESPT